MNRKELQKQLARIPLDAEIYLTIWKGDDPNGLFGYKVVALDSAQIVTIRPDYGPSKQVFLLGQTRIDERIVPYFNERTPD